MGRVKSLMAISSGMRSFHFQDFFSEDQRRSKTKALEFLKTTLANGTHIFHSEIPFGNFGLPLQKSRFPEKFPFGETKLILPFTFHPKFSKFLGKWQTTSGTFRFDQNLLPGNFSLVINSNVNHSQVQYNTITFISPRI